MLDSVIGTDNGELSTKNQLVDTMQAKGRRRKITPAPLNIPTSRLAFGHKEVKTSFHVIYGKKYTLFRVSFNM